MRDGTTLRADVWRPDRDGSFPVLLQRLPYDKSVTETTTVHGGLDPIRAVDAGYAVVIQDTRGRWASEGAFRPFADEALDGADTVAWCASLPFSSGAVGMYGQSYFGATQLLAATTAPTTLRALVPTATGSEYYEGWTYQGGAFQLGFVLFWTLFGLAPDAISRRPAQERPRLQALLDHLLADPWATYRRLPLGDLGGLEQVVPFYHEWLEHDRRDEFWRAIAPNERYGAIATPALHVGGWYDIFVAGTLENFARLRVEAATEEARRGQRLLVGPWSHACLADTIGELEFGPHASFAALDTTSLFLEWFDARLRGAATEEGAPVRIFLMGANRWRDDDQWPPRSVVPERWHLHSGGAANTLAGDGILERDPCVTEEPRDTFVYDPADPVPTGGGASFLPGLFVGRHAGARNQQEIESRRDVLVYTSAPLEADLDVIGSVAATLHVATSAADTDFTAKLVDVHLDGRAYLVCDGILALRNRESLDHAVETTPGEVYEITVALGATANRFRPGHRLRLEVSSSNFPRFARNPNTGVRPTLAREHELAPARQHVFHDAVRPSFLTLQVLR